MGDLLEVPKVCTRHILPNTSAAAHTRSSTNLAPRKCQTVDPFSDHAGGPVDVDPHEGTGGLAGGVDAARRHADTVPSGGVHEGGAVVDGKSRPEHRATIGPF